MSRAKKSDELSKEVIIDFLKKNKPRMKKEFGVVKIALFGSYARGEQEITSDIDILIELKTHDFRKRMKVKHFLEDSFGKKIDIGYFDSLRPGIWRFVQEDLIYA
jgi:Predicted nucleotidyltransferases